jgi:hypothetical protein
LCRYSLDLAFTPAVEAHLNRLGYTEQLDHIAEETFYSEGHPTSSAPVACSVVGRCRLNQVDP